MVGGNIKASVLARKTSKNELGEDVTNYKPITKINGWLDYTGGQTKYEAFKSPVEDSTHVFICDYRDFKGDRLIIGRNTYDVLYVDDPMGLHLHLEIFLRLIK